MPGALDTRRELAIIADDDKVMKKLGDVIEQDWKHSKPLDLSDEDLLLAYADHEAAVEQETPTALYPEVLAEAFRRTGATLGEAAPDHHVGAVGERPEDRGHRQAPGVEHVDAHPGLAVGGFGTCHTSATAP